MAMAPEGHWPVLTAHFRVGLTSSNALRVTWGRWELWQVGACMSSRQGPPAVQQLWVSPLQMPDPCGQGKLEMFTLMPNFLHLNVGSLLTFYKQKG